MVLDFGQSEESLKITPVNHQTSGRAQAEDRARSSRTNGAMEKRHALQRPCAKKVPVAKLAHQF